jgi:serine/threonine protein kinase
MGVVWEAWHTTLGIPVAVKLLKDNAKQSEAKYALERFRMEAQLAAKLNHPGIVRVLDFGEEDRPYLVMELVRGPDLHAWIHNRGTADEIVALKVVGHIAVGLASMHRCGVVHRDLKPSNVLISDGTALKITDLGLARSPGNAFDDERLSGTPQYMAPESLDASGQVDPRSDLYSLGVIFYRMIFGRVPFRGTTQEVMKAQLWEKPQWTLPEGASVDAGTLFIARRLMEKDPARRLQSALEVVQACREQVARLESRREEQEKPSTEARSIRRPLMRERLAALRSLQAQNAKNAVRKWRRVAVWGAGGICLVVLGFLVGRL